jgi:S-DNA-T family DNA segregation ATPase FtsK/SpoIIIE
MSDPARRTLDGQPRASPSAVRLSVVEGPTIGQEFKIEGVATIGRSPDATVMVDDPGVSRLHVRVRLGQAGGFEVEDLGSKNGTFRAQDRVGASIQLSDGDIVRIGSLCLTIRVPGPSATTETAV